MDSNIQKSSRLLEIDFFRGAALLVIFWNHLFRYIKIGIPMEYGFSDAAAVFIFLSGYVSGLVYWKTYQAKGFKGTFRKAGKRAVQIYIAHILASTAMIIISEIVPSLERTKLLQGFGEIFNQNPILMSFKILTLQYFPPLFDILPLYILLILAVPFVLFLYKRDWKIVFFISLALYTATQIFPQFDFAKISSSWFLNPFSWFFLFSTAMLIGIKNREGTLKVKANPLYIFVAAFVVVYAFCDLKTVEMFLERIGIISKNMAYLFPSPFPLIDKDILQPVMIIHFFSLVYLVSLIAEYIRPLLKSPILYPIVIAGQHSLPLFSTEIVLNYLFIYLMLAFDSGIILYLFFAGLGWGIILALGHILSIKKKQKKLKNVESPPSLGELNFNTEGLGK